MEGSAFVLDIVYRILIFSYFRIHSILLYICVHSLTKLKRLFVWILLILYKWGVNTILERKLWLRSNLILQCYIEVPVNFLISKIREFFRVYLLIITVLLYFRLYRIRRILDFLLFTQCWFFFILWKNWIVNEMYYLLLFDTSGRIYSIIKWSSFINTSRYATKNERFGNWLLCGSFTFVKPK